MRLLRLVCLTLLVALLATPAAGAHDDVQIVGERTIAGQVEPIATHVDPVGPLKPPAAGVSEPLAPMEPVAPTAQLPETWCGTKRADDDTANAVHAAGTPDVKAVYAIAADQFTSSRDTRFATVAHRMQADASAVARHVAAASGGRRTIRFDRGTSCGAAYLDIQAVVLPRTLAEYFDADGAPRFSLLTGDLRGLVAGAAPRNWFVYLDGFDNPYASGQGHFYPQAEQPDAVPHDRGGLFALTYGQTALPSNAYANPSTMLHEIGHNIGAVGYGAPNSTDAAHCVDEWDVMCYAENGHATVVDDTNCARDTTRAIQQNWDCKGDDYFNARPAAGSYLEESWNTFHSAHLGACSTELAATCGLAGAAPDGTPPRNTTPRSSSSTWYTADYAVALSATDAESGVAGYAWRVDGGPAQTTTTARVTGDGTHTLQTRMRDAAGNWSPWRADTVRIDTGAPVAAVSCPSGWLTVASSCTASVPAPGADFDRLEVQVGTAAATTHFTTSRTVAVSLEGETVVRARARDLAGNTSAWASATIRQDLNAPLAGVACPSGWRPADATCTITGSDAASGLQSLSWTVDGGAPQTGPSGSTVTVGAGVHTVTATATDGVGRTKSTSATVKVDKTAPVATLSCPTAWVQSAGCTVTGVDAESGVVDRQVSVAGLAPVSAFDGLYTVVAPGTTTLAGRVVNGAGTPSDLTAAAAVRVDGTAPSVSLTCEPASAAGRHRCTAAAGDAESGVASVRLVRDGAFGDAVTPSEPFEVVGPVALAAVATDGAGRTATSAVRALAGAAAPAPPAPPITVPPPVVLPPAPSPPAPSPSAGPRQASAQVGGAGRSLATGSVAVTTLGDGGAQAALELAPARLGRGTWRLEVCAGSRCVRRTVTLRRPGTPKALRATLAVPQGDVRARFTVLRRAGRAFRRQATRTALVPGA